MIKKDDEKSEQLLKRRVERPLYFFLLERNGPPCGHHRLLRISDQHPKARLLSLALMQQRLVSPQTSSGRVSTDGGR